MIAFFLAVLPRNSALIERGNALTESGCASLIDAAKAVQERASFVTFHITYQTTTARHSGF